FPVIDSIPVLRQGRVNVQDHVSGSDDVLGPTIGELVDQVSTGHGLRALTNLFAFPPTLPFGTARIPLLRIVLSRGLAHRVALAQRRREVRRRLSAPLPDQTAEDWFDLCYLRSREIEPELHPYFLMRFGQPRYLSSLALLQVLRPSTKPVLDLACGFGHLMHHLAVRQDPVGTVGMDRNFFQLFVARRWIATGSSYVCADAADGLPFTDGAFSATLCTDAFHLLDDKARCLTELRRCAERGTVVLDRFGNADLEPREAHELSPQGYLDLVGNVERRMVGETELIDSYLQRRGPQLAEQRPLASLGREKWLSLVIGDEPGLFTDHGSVDGWPHGEGPLGLNPIYRVEDLRARWRLRFAFPTTWYAFENARMVSYHAAGLTVEDELLVALARGERTERIGEMVDRFVVLGIPPNYLRPPAARVAQGGAAMRSRFRQQITTWVSRRPKIAAWLAGH
ncbi:MAG: class I SAM-dependent methyltransferase, partial [Pseudonocardiaceae bacterium]